MLVIPRIASPKLDLFEGIFNAEFNYGKTLDLFEGIFNAELNYGKTLGKHETHKGYK